MLPNLITDRTAVDVSYLLQQVQKWQNGTMTDEEKTEFLAGLKGAYNAVDLNRVEGAVKSINDYMNGFQAAFDTLRASLGVADDSFWLIPFTPLSFETKTDWTMSDAPTKTDLDGRYLRNVDKLTDQFPIEKSLPTSVANNLTFDGANAIERALLAVYEAAKKYETETKQLIKNTAAGWAQSGEIYGGEF